MKKVILATAALLLAGATVNAQSILSSIFGNKDDSEKSRRRWTKNLRSSVSSPAR